MRISIADNEIKTFKRLMETTLDSLELTRQACATEFGNRVGHKIPPDERAKWQKHSDELMSEIRLVKVILEKVEEHQSAGVV